MRVFRFALVILCAGFISSQASKAEEEVSVGVRARVSPNQTSELNALFAAPVLRLEPSPNYHVGIGMIQGVPKSRAQAFMTEIRQFLRNFHNIENSNLKFQVKAATTFFRIDSDNYKGESLILLPGDSDKLMLMRLNTALNRFVYEKAQVFNHLRLDIPTSPSNYIPHITVKTPTKNRKEIVDAAIQYIWARPGQYNPTVYLSGYGVSIHNE